ncbi:MAG TPA: glycoside hydrolase family 15 protein [Chloroflexota bacterium]|nr:glycoside hydrolase family 15 protein [Chloroflexota bacterium]
MAVPFITYAPIERHGAIGNRRTAALVAADGTIDWLCMPDYDGTVVFGVLLAPDQGGYCRIGPAELRFGQQRYLGRSPVLVTTWSTAEWELELTDFMETPRDNRPEARSLVRRLRCLRGETLARVDVRVCYEFERAAASTHNGHGVIFDLDAFETTLWCNQQLEVEGPRARADVPMREGQECSLVFHYGRSHRQWTPRRVEQALEGTRKLWSEWHGRITYDGPRAEQLHRSASVIHLMGYAPAGSSVAAPTCSLPERIGGNRNYDYRFAWVRDASLSASTLAMIGDVESAGSYMDWLANLSSRNSSPVQVAYGVNGETELKERERSDVPGYRESLPVRFGNHVFDECQLGGLGYVADCAYLYLKHGGRWTGEHWRLIRRIADYTAEHWQEQDHGIWELQSLTHHVSSKVMSWVTLTRAIAIARELDDAANAAEWERIRQAIHEEVLTRGWSQGLNAFRQSYGSDTVDASSLLIPLMGFLPPEDRRVRLTVDRLEEWLMLNGFLHRFDPAFTEGVKPMPLGEFEGAFLPSNFMLASVYAMLGRASDAEAVLDRLEGVAGELGLFAEEVDARSGAFLGNTPLLFSHAEHVRAILALAAGGTQVA